MDSEMYDQVANGDGFIAALDQSGGSTPKALEQYGVPRDAYTNDDEMFDLVHQMRSRIVTSPTFTGDRVLGAILFEGTMAREIEGVPSATYLWRTKGIVPFVKVDQGLADEADGVQLMKPLTKLDDLLDRAVGHEVFGTKMRSVVGRADAGGIERIVDQQFEVGRRILDAGLVPILEPEVDIHAPDKADAEELLRERITAHLDQLPDDRQVMLKLTIPTVDGFYTPLIDHPRVLRVVALSGGYSRDEANQRLARNPGLIASFSRALIGELAADQSDDEFDAALDLAVRSIYEASTA
ncbi:fructose bisphosphate aldolase [Nitriliruptor alkaliphilus]|uniref:fructose bisphosphate aldolase n=1 Tax=Nitriliruptor alkaliphilus TaxID=427918 RepID=UPI000AF66230|nr:fructose bisphosphate aldolase [Nitriliruptor alkaliphilus]